MLRMNISDVRLELAKDITSRMRLSLFALLTFSFLALSSYSTDTTSQRKFDVHVEEIKKLTNRYRNYRESVFPDRNNYSETSWQREILNECKPVSLKTSDVHSIIWALKTCNSKLEDMIYVNREILGSNRSQLEHEAKINFEINILALDKYLIENNELISRLDNFKSFLTSKNIDISQNFHELNIVESKTVEFLNISFNILDAPFVALSGILLVQAYFASLSWQLSELANKKAIGISGFIGFHNNVIGRVLFILWLLFPSLVAYSVINPEGIYIVMHFLLYWLFPSVSLWKIYECKKRMKEINPIKAGTVEPSD